MNVTTNDRFEDRALVLDALTDRSSFRFSQSGRAPADPRGATDQ
jgi:hypothetical protein